MRVVWLLAGGMSAGSLGGCRSQCCQFACVAGYGALVVDIAVVAAAPHAPCAGLLLAIVPGFRCHGVLLPFAAFSLTNIIPKLAFSHRDICQLFGFFCFPRAGYLITVTASLHSVGVLLAVALPLTDIVSKSSSPIAIFARSSVSRVCSHQLFAALVGAGVLFLATTFSFADIVSELAFSIVMFPSSHFPVFPAPPSSGMRPCTICLSGRELGRLPTLYPISPLSSVIVFNSCISGASGASRRVASIAFSLWQLL